MTRSEAAIPAFLVTRLLARGNRWSLALTVVLMAVSFVNLIFVASLFGGIMRGSEDQVINAYVGHVTIGPRPGERLIDHVEAQLARIRRTPGVVGVSAQTIVPGVLRHGNTVVAREILAVDPRAEATVTNIRDKMIAGSFLAPNDTDGIVLGIQIAGGPDVELDGTSFRGAKVGEAVLLALDDGSTRTLTIRGIFRTKFLTTDLRAFITRDLFDAMRPAARDRATTLIVRGPSRGGEEALIQSLRRHGVDGRFSTWEDNAGITKTITKSFASVNALLSVVALLIAAVTIFIVIYIDVVNRRRQIGILRALGIKAWIIRATYVMKSSAYAAAGLVIGFAIFFLALEPYFHARPLALPICDAVLLVDGRDLLWRSLAILLVAIVAGLIPAIFTTRSNIVDEIVSR